MSHLPSAHDLRGLWTRTFLQHHGGEADITSSVSWLQGPRFFVDLRQPADLTNFERIRCLRELDATQTLELARQSGFAGEFAYDGTSAHWHRMIDYQPDSGVPDRATMQFENEVLVERGLADRYLERWVRTPASTAPFRGLALRSLGEACRGYLVQAGEWLMFARDRRVAALPSGRTLGELVTAAQMLEERQDLVDLEVSLGRREGQIWTIERSTLPYKSGRRWGITIGTEVEMEDLTSTGAPTMRRWQILSSDSSGYTSHGQRSHD